MGEAYCLLLFCSKTTTAKHFLLLDIYWTHCLPLPMALSVGLIVLGPEPSAVPSAVVQQICRPLSCSDLPCLSPTPGADTLHVQSLGKSPFSLYYYEGRVTMFSLSATTDSPTQTPGAPTTVRVESYPMSCSVAPLPNFPAGGTDSFLSSGIPIANNTPGIILIQTAGLGRCVYP